MYRTAFLTLALLGITFAQTSAQTSLDKSTHTNLQNNLQNDAQIEARVQDLLSKMTLSEKIGQMIQIDVLRMMGDPNNEWDRGPLEASWMKIVLDDYQVGSILSGGGAAPVPNTPANWLEMTQKLKSYALEHSRLKIPLLYGVDAVHGHNNVQGATFYPHNIGLGATFDPQLLHELGKQTALAVRSTGILWNFAPVADLGRDPRWGRFYETFGEDSVLTSSLVTDQIKGQLEGGGIATIKHFYGYGSALNGVDRGDTLLEDAVLRRYDLPAYRAAVQAGAQTVMVNSGSVRGVPAHASSEILQNLLRQELGFKGVVLSDWEDILKIQTVHRFANSYKEAIKVSVNNGVDVAMIPHDAATYARLLTELVQEGAVSQKRIDQAVGNMLRLKLEAGLFDAPVPKVSLDNLKNPALAKRAALESMTLLENKNNILPLKTSFKKLTVAGDSADVVDRILGGWSINWQGLGNEQVSGVNTVWQALQVQTPKTTRLVLATNTLELKAEATSSDALILVLGEKPYAEGQGDTANPTLTSAQSELLKAAKATNKPVILVLLAGRPLILPELPSALLLAYLPGSMGAEAIAETLWGKANPSGRLPFSYPKSSDQLPMNYNRANPSSYAPLYPFGTGLSYTTFGYTQLHAQQSGSTLNVSLEVKNTGKLEGDHIVQLYAAKGSTQRQLAAFTRVTLKPGQSKTITLEFPTSNLATLSSDAKGQFVGGMFSLSVGDVKVDLALK